MSRILKTSQLLICLFFLISCQTDDDIQIEEIEKTVTISNEDILEYDLGIFGDEEGASIRKKPLHFEKSELYYDESDSYKVKYRYKPEATFSGTDYVELISAYGSNGASPNNYKIVTKLTIEVE